MGKSRPLLRGLAAAMFVLFAAAGVLLFVAGSYVGLTGDATWVYAIGFILAGLVWFALLSAAADVLDYLDKLVDTEQE